MALGRARRNVGIMSSRAMSELKDQPLHASTSEAVTNNVRVEVESQYAPGALAAVSEPVVLPLHRPHHQRGRRHGPAAQPPLDHHRRDRPHRRSARAPGVVGEQPVLRARRVVPVHVGVSAEDVDRRDARHLSDGDRGRRPLRRRDRAVRAPRAVHRSLSTSRSLTAESARTRRDSRAHRESQMRLCASGHVPCVSQLSRVAGTCESRRGTRRRSRPPSWRRRRRSRADRRSSADAARPCRAASCRGR